jgi:nucleotide-binding universal stress UspA family protein
LQTGIDSELTKGARVLDRIVVGYAKDQAGRDAVALAGVFAALAGGRLTAVFPYHPLLARVDAEEACARAAAEVKALLDGPEPTLRWSSSSWPIRALHELAGYERASLIVFGAAKEGLGDRLHVSLMERMVHGAPCAVAVAPEGYSRSGEAAGPTGSAARASGEAAGHTDNAARASGEAAGHTDNAARASGEAAGAADDAGDTSHALRRIGVGFSTSHEGHAALDLARELTEASGGQLRVIAGAGLEPALASYSFSSPALAEVEEELYKDTEQTLQRFCEELSGDGAALQHETVRGDPASVLIERSSQLDLLVLGSRAYGPVRHVLLGSVSASVMREARCPVLVVPRGVAPSDERDHEQPAGAARRG